MTVLEQILKYLEQAIELAKLANSATVNDPAIAAGAALATVLEGIASKVAAAYQLQTGTPLDLTKLHIEPDFPIPPAI